tara:strand:+ start:138 stop:392 length:255 start_codon:yes stop_codon:yes gene_type:complete
MENIFEIKNNFIPKKNQEEISQKFIDPSMDLGRNGKMTESVLGTENSFTEGSMQPIDNVASIAAPIIGQIPIPQPQEEITNEEI